MRSTEQAETDLGTPADGTELSQGMKPWMIDAGIRTLEETHPLSDEIEWKDISPCFFCCNRKMRRPGRADEDQRLLLRRRGLNIGKKETHSAMEFPSDDCLSEKFVKAGYGPNAYFDIQKSLIKMLACITVLLLPVIYIYYSANAAENKSIYLRTFLGNLGGAHTICEKQRMKYRSLEIQCAQGLVLKTEYAKFGVVSNQLKYSGYCHETKLNKIL